MIKLSDVILLQNKFGDFALIFVFCLTERLCLNCIFGFPQQDFLTFQGAFYVSNSSRSSFTQDSVYGHLRYLA